MFFKKGTVFVRSEKQNFRKMSFLYIVLTSFFLSFTTQNEIPYTSIERAFSSGNATEIVNLGKDKMLINVLGKEGAYGQSQATLVLKDFFDKKPSVGFKFIFKGKETADGSFAIGTYDSKVESFRVTIHFKKINNDFRIESLTIEKS